MKFQTLFVLLCLCLVSNYANGEETTVKVVNENDYEYIPQTGSLYKLHTEHKKNEDAKTTCEGEGAILYYPDTENNLSSTMSFLQNKYKEALPTHILLGLEKTGNEFKTIDGISISKVYVKWNPDEPNNPTTEMCVELLLPGLTMNNVPCSLEYPFICKSLTKAWNEQCHVQDPDYVYSEETGKCYKFHLRPKTWDDAQTICRGEQSKLAVINSHEEAAYLVRLTRQFIRHVPGRFSRGVVLLGFHNNNVGDWQTVEGTSLYYSGYACWGNNQPDGGEQDRCGSMFYNGHLNDIACDQKAFFICEHKNAALNYVYEPRSFYNVIQAVHCHDSI